MKLLTAMVTTALLIAAPGAKAGETWVKVTDTYRKTVTPGTLAEEFGWHGMAFYLDLQSIVTKGEITYYNDSWIPVDAYNMPDKRLLEDNWDFRKNQPLSKNARQVKCATLETFKPASNSFISAKGELLEIAKMVCR